MEYLDAVPIWAFFVGMVIVVMALLRSDFASVSVLQDRGSNPETPV